MLNRSLSIVLFAVLSVGFASQALAQDRATEVRQILEERDREIKSLLGTRETFTDAQREQLKDVVNRGIDFEAMGRTALGNQWASLTEKQRSEFVTVFRRIVRTQSLSNLDVYRAKVSYDDVAVDGQNAEVVTTTVYKDVPTEVRYELAFRDDQWRVQDIIIDDVSTVEGYARSFQTVIRKRGFDGLMTSLNKKLEKMSS